MDSIPWLDNMIGQTSQILGPRLRGANDQYEEDSGTGDSAGPTSSPPSAENSAAHTFNYHGPSGSTLSSPPRPQSFELPPIHYFPGLSGTTQSFSMLQNPSLPPIHHILSHCSPAIGPYQPPTENSAVRPPEGDAIPLRGLESEPQDQKPPRSLPSQDTEENMGISPCPDAVIRQTSQVLNPHLRGVIDEHGDRSCDASYLSPETANPTEVPESSPPTPFKNTMTIPDFFLRDPYEPPAGFELGRDPSPLTGVLRLRESKEDPSILEGLRTEKRTCVKIPSYSRIMDTMVEMPPSEAEEILKRTFADDSRLQAFFEQKGVMAQQWLDQMQQLAERPSILPAFRSSIFTSMLRLSKNSGLHPKCLAIRNVRKFGEHPITAGGFGDVWKGVVGASNEIVCLKIMKVYLNSDRVQLSKEYLREAILWRQMKHPNLLPCLGIYELEDSHQLCLISPWMENGNLVQYLKNTPEEDVSHYTLARDVAAGLSYLHLMKLVHGDLKGLNVLITKFLRACITDFGLSRVADTHALRMPATSTTRPVGTARWLAPELVMGGCETTKASDVYAYACVCYEIFTGQHPFPEFANEMAVAFNVAQGKRPSRPENTPRLTDPMWALMELCWRALPTSRPTADQVYNTVLNIDVGKSFLLAPDWDESTYAQVRANVEDKAFSIGSPSGTRSDEVSSVSSLHLMPGQEYLPVSYQALRNIIDEDYRKKIFKEIGLSLDGYDTEPSTLAS
ncbi:hypothetical protein PQX77_020189 [Marasmius sp. AFHP31]|nr:hypothetical protein PQX77_020189 [Marasmius sp. AFHP31]